ncbi:Hypothetical_protein [Hexamita inflata]|uniref:Hypothetical_protein n=1 Tax=Hexamita inflata TaxID=28002 RepID=A0AA86R8Q2_9EUKA|nr:Hypothetical protein HINF_LOCUS58033 [Hexamita inflata]
MYLYQLLNRNLRYVLSCSNSSSRRSAFRKTSQYYDSLVPLLGLTLLLLSRQVLFSLFQDVFNVLDFVHIFITSSRRHKQTSLRLSKAKHWLSHTSVSTFKTGSTSHLCPLSKDPAIIYIQQRLCSKIKQCPLYVFRLNRHPYLPPQFNSIFEHIFRFQCFTQQLSLQSLRFPNCFVYFGSLVNQEDKCCCNLN